MHRYKYIYIYIIHRYKYIYIYIIHRYKYIYIYTYILRYHDIKEFD